MITLLPPGSGPALEPHVTPYSVDFAILDDGAAGGNLIALGAFLPGPGTFDIRSFFGSRSAYLTPIFEKVVATVTALELQFAKLDILIFKAIHTGVGETEPAFIPNTGPLPGPLGVAIAVPGGGTGFVQFWRVRMQLRHSESA